MREIVFRGKCADDGKWREKEYRDGRLYTGTECYDFIEGTACEWTGLNDENGRNIFEGDIVRDTEDNCIGVVKFGIYDNPGRADDDGGHLGFHIQWVEKIVMRRNDILFWADKIKVIGNIFDNQELIRTRNWKFTARSVLLTNSGEQGISRYRKWLRMRQPYINA